MTEFKQIIGRGTRVFDGKDYFTIIDFTGATNLFYDPAWDGEQLVEEPSDLSVTSLDREDKNGDNSPLCKTICFRIMRLMLMIFSHKH